MVVEIESVIVIGTGLMGIGIAQVSIEAGLHVTLVGRSEDKCQAARAKIAAAVGRSARRRLPNDAAAQKEHVEAALDSLELVAALADARLHDADLVVESIVEDLKVKQELFAEIEAAINSDCLMVTNTSSFLLADVFAKVHSRANCAALHFFNPVAAMKLVEVVGESSTSVETLDTLRHYIRRVGKTPVQCKDSHGFIVNRLLVPYIAESVRMAERGDAEPRDIDEAMKLGCGHPLGPFELADFIGLDTLKHICDGWHAAHPHDPRFEPVASFNKLVAEGKLGRKSGAGFYVHTPR